MPGKSHGPRSLVGYSPWGHRESDMTERLLCVCVHCSLLVPKMSVFILAISCLTTSNLPWFMDLTFQALMKYCSLQHRTLLSTPDTPTTGHNFHCYSSSLLDTYWPGEFIFQYPIFLPFHTVHGVLKARIWSGLPFLSPVDRVLSELSTMTRLSWVVLHGMAHSFIELDKAVIHVISLVSFL